MPAKSYRLNLFRALIAVTSVMMSATSATAEIEIDQNLIAAPLLAQTNFTEFNYENYDFWVDQCLTLTEQQQPSEALTACEKAIVLEPKKDNTEIWMARSQNLFELGRYAETIVSINQVIAASPHHSGAMAYQCAALFQLQQYGSAIEHCEQALQMDGDWGNVSPEFAWYYHGLTLHAIGRLETALTSFSQAVRLNPEDKLAKAECLSTALEVNSTDASICDPQAPIAVSSGDSLPQPSSQSSPQPLSTPSPASPEATFQQVIRMSEQALAIDPSRPEIWFQQGLALEQLGQYERALTAFDRALQLQNTSSLTLAHRCAVLNLLEHYEPALESCNRAFQADQRWGILGAAYGFTQQSLALMGLGRLEESLAAIDQAVALESPYAVVALTQRSNVLSAMGRYDEAITTAQSAIDLDPGPVDAATQESSGNSDPAPTTEQEPNDNLDPADASALNSQAVSYWLRGELSDYEKANTIIQTALASYKQPQVLQETFESTTYVEPLALRLRGQILAQFNQGRIFSSLNNRDQAIAAYDQALDLYNQANQHGISTLSNPLFAELLLNQGAVYLDFYPNLAAQSFEKAVNLDPARFEAWYNWALSLTRLGEYDRATRAYDQAEQLKPNTAAVQAGRLQIMLGQASVLAQKGKTQDAMALYDQVLAIDPTNETAQQQLQQLIQSSVSPGR